MRWNWQSGRSAPVLPPEVAARHCRGDNRGEIEVAFVMRNLAVLDYSQGFTLWVYRLSSDTLESAMSDNYFGPAADMMEVGDVMIISGRTGAAVRCITDIVVGVVGGPDRVTLAEMS